jgi:RNA 3'-terminal phosphate cyclase (ATP)
MVILDGSIGEGGGQILRTALGLSLVTGTPFRIERIRAGRNRPGLLRQHLTAVQAATAIGGAAVEGDELTSQALTFTPGRVKAGEYKFAVGTAGSTTLVLQTILPALLVADGASRITIEGGTHNPAAPPFDFLARVFLPLVSRMGPRIDAVLERPGFYPAGGGRIVITIDPAPGGRLTPLTLDERGDVVSRRVMAITANLDPGIGRREVSAAREKLGWDESMAEFEVRTMNESSGPGNVLLIEVASAHVTEMFAEFGERGIRAEQVAHNAVRDVRRYLTAGVPVGSHLADQLLIPMAMAGAGSFRTTGLTPHARTNIEVIQRFLDVPIVAHEDASDAAERDSVLVRIG